jgi:septum formation protein
LDISTGRMRTGYARSRVTFHRLSSRVIARLLERGSPLDKAGGYALQEDRGELIAKLEGSRTNVIGLPLEHLRRKLAKGR